MHRRDKHLVLTWRSCCCLNRRTRASQPSSGARRAAWCTLPRRHACACPDTRCPATCSARTPAWVRAPMCSRHPACMCEHACLLVVQGVHACPLFVLYICSGIPISTALLHVKADAIQAVCQMLPAERAAPARNVNDTGCARYAHAGSARIVHALFAPNPLDSRPLSRSTSHF